MPNVIWQYNNKSLPDPLRIKHESIYGMTALTMAKVKKSDAGNYSVSLENQFGKASVTVKVKIMGKLII